LRYKSGVCKTHSPDGRTVERIHSTEFFLKWISVVPNHANAAFQKESLTLDNQIDLSLFESRYVNNDTGAPAFELK
jgi:hypothetical protein